MPKPQSQFADLSAAAPQPQAMDGYYIIRGYRGDDALNSVMDLPRAEAIQAMEETQPTRGKGPARADGTRDQATYYDDRAQAESWVRDNADLPKNATEAPVYFAISKDKDALLANMAKHAPPGTRLIVAPVTPALAARLTVTAGDSMGHHFAALGYTDPDGSTPFLDKDAPLKGKVMSFADWTRQAKGAGIIEGEAQLWTRDPLPGAVTLDAADVAAKATSRFTASFVPPAAANTETAPAAPVGKRIVASAPKP